MTTDPPSPLPVARRGLLTRWLPQRYVTERAVREGAQLYARALGSTVISEQFFKLGLEGRVLRDTVQNPYSQVFAVYVAISRVARDAASVRFSITNTKIRRGETERTVLEEHPLYDLLLQPNALMIGNQLREATHALRELTGEAFWRLDGIEGPGASKAPTGITLLSGTFTPLFAGGELSGWKHKPENAPAKDYSLEQLVRFAYLHPSKPYEAMAPMETAGLPASLCWSATKIQELFYRNGMVPPFYLSFSDQSPTDPEREKMREGFRERFGGLFKFWNPIFLFRGAELKTVAVDQKSAESIAILLTSTKMIFSVFGLPMSVGGFVEDANRSVTVEDKRLWWGGKIMSVGEMEASVIQVGLVDRFWPGLAYELDWQAKFAQVMPEEQRAATSSAHTMIQDGIPPKDAYRIHGIELDTEDQPHLEIGWLPFNLVPASMLMESGGQTTTSATSEAALPRLPRRGWPHGEAIRSTIWRAFERVKQPVERKMLGDWRGFLRWLRDTILASLKSPVAAHLTGRHSVDRLLTRQSPDEVIPPLTTVEQEAARRMRAVLELAAKVGWDSLSSQVDAGLEFDVTDLRIIQLLTERTVAIKGAADTVTERVRESLAAGIAQGESSEQLTERIEGFFSAEFAGKARVVAQMETASAFSLARHEAIAEAGIEQHEWLSSRDMRVRESHLIDGEIVKLGATFSNGLRFPLDPQGTASETMGCRCVALPVVT